MSAPLPEAEVVAILDVLAFYAEELVDGLEGKPAAVALLSEAAAAGELGLGRDRLTLGDVRAGRYYRQEVSA